VNPELINMLNTRGAEHWANASIDTDNTSHRIVFGVITDRKLQAPSAVVIGKKSDNRFVYLRAKL